MKPDDFWARVALPGPNPKLSRRDHCWEWEGPPMNTGYGQLRVNGKHLLSHRVAYELAIGPIPDGMVLDHVVCENRICANPWHVKPETRGRNASRGWWESDRCPKRGHLFDEVNTYIRPAGTRQCRACDAMMRTSRRAR